MTRVLCFVIKINFEKLQIIFFVTENRAGPSNLGNVISQILLCKQITPDFHQEELCSISKDSQEISKILKEMQEYMPRQENNLGKYIYLNNFKKLHKS